MNFNFLKFASGLIFLIVAFTLSEATAEDGRTPVYLDEPERQFVLEEMRGFIEILQLVMNGLSANNMEEIARGAKLSGKATSNKAPSTLGRKFPPEFAALGGNTHQLWDELAAEAEDMGDSKEIISQLGALLGNCTACHSAYRLAQETP